MFRILYYTIKLYTIIVLVSTKFYIPQDRLKSILNELIELASLIKLSRLFQARMEDRTVFITVCLKFRHR